MSMFETLCAQIKPMVLDSNIKNRLCEYKQMVNTK